MASVSKDMKLEDEGEATGEETSDRKEKVNKTETTLAAERSKRRSTAFDLSQPWHLFIKNNSDMEDWYLALVQASSPLPPGATDPADPLGPVFSSADMAHLVATLDAQPDAIPTRWLNALLGRLFFSVYRTAKVEAYILGRLANKLAKVKRPGFLTALSVREVSVGSRPPTISTPMLKELTRWGDAALELKFLFDGEVRLTIAATAEVSLGARFRPYVVQLVLAVVVRKVEGNVLVKVKRPPSNRIWYAFTSMPKLEIDVLPVVSDREIKWGVVLKPIETQLKEIIRESIVMPNMDDIPFFESAKYQHRGGIWPDAARRQYNPENDDPSTAPKTNIELNAQSDSPPKASSSAPPSVIGHTTDSPQPQPNPDLPSSESTPTLPLSPNSKAATATDEPAENLTLNTVRSRTPSPVGDKASPAEEPTKETGPQKEGSKEKDKVTAGPEVTPSPKRTSWFSRTPLSISSTSSDGTRGRTTNTGPGSTGAKPIAANVRGRSTPRSPLLLEVEGESTNMGRLASSLIPSSNVDNTGTSAQVDTSAQSEPPTQDTPENQNPSDSTPTSNNVAARSTTPTLTVNGIRRSTISHQTSQSASGNFYSGGSVSSSSLPPTETSPTATFSDRDAAKESTPGTSLGASASPTVSSVNTPSDVSNFGIVDSNELTRTQSDSSSNSLSVPTSLAVSTAPKPADTPAASRDTNLSNVSSPTSLFTTWKTRATDKQALSNTAKEAMKKWSVGWNNLKRGVEEERERRRVNNTGGTSTSNNARSDAEDDGSGSDAGMGGAGSESTKKGVGKKTYAELRAEVMSRREGTPTPADSPGPQDSTFPGGISSLAKPRPNNVSVAPSAPRTTTEVHTGSPGLFEEPTPVIEQPKLKPIGVQPGRAAGMMIPGIHASHQGEVMALGSSPAETEPASKDNTNDKVVERERTLSANGRPTSIQNVYRLFGQRTISANSSNSSNLSSSKMEIVKQPRATASSASIDTISVTPVDDQPPDSPFSPPTPTLTTPRLAPDMSPPSSRPPPPPLPPRKQSITSAASEALKKLAAEDAARTSRPQSPQVPFTSEEDTSGTSTPNGIHRPVSPTLPSQASMTAD